MVARQRPRGRKRRIRQRLAEQQQPARLQRRRFLFPRAGLLRRNRRNENQRTVGVQQRILRRAIHAARTAADHRYPFFGQHGAKPCRHVICRGRNLPAARHRNGSPLQQRRISLHKEEERFPTAERAQRLRPFPAFRQNQPISLLFIGFQTQKRVTRPGEKHFRAFKRRLRQHVRSAQDEPGERAAFHHSPHSHAGKQRRHGFVPCDGRKQAQSGTRRFHQPICHPPHAPRPAE